VKVIDQKPIAEIDDQTLILADVARKALQQVQATVVEILSAGGMPPDRAGQVADTLTGGQWTHDYPITLEEARQLGLPVTAGILDSVYDLMHLYPQAAQRRPSVEYIPVPYRPAHARATRRP